MPNVLNEVHLKKDGNIINYKIGDVVEGYYNNIDGKFYEDSTFTIEIPGASGFLYVDKAEYKIYHYNDTTSTFVYYEDLAENISYDNTTSGLVADDVQGAIDEVNEKIPFTLGIENNQYGYYDSNENFVDFKSQADIDSAVAAAKVGNASTGDVLSGKTFTNSSTSGLTGGMTNNGAVSPAGLNAGGSYTIPAGYHNGSGKVVANSLASQTAGTAAAGDIVASKTAWVNGSKLTGTLADHRTNGMIVPQWGTPGSNIPATRAATVNPRVNFDNTNTYGNAEMIEIAMPGGAYAWSYDNSGCCIPTETKSVTATTSAQTVTPSNYGTSGQYVKYLKSVTVNPQSHSGTSTVYTKDISGSGSTIDLGATHNTRYLNVIDDHFDGMLFFNLGTYRPNASSNDYSVVVSYVGQFSVYYNSTKVVNNRVTITRGTNYNIVMNSATSSYGNLTFTLITSASDGSYKFQITNNTTKVLYLTNSTFNVPYYRNNFFMFNYPNRAVLNVGATQVIENIPSTNGFRLPNSSSEASSLSTLYSLVCSAAIHWSTLY